ncbi:MAG: serine hydrolase domain-containing protein [Hominilimicola sp.]|uniref:serine hydrolase domain-containing protein n=1 Tax=Hominilimicola sp. TaxID=3073571 RepID=UPI00399A8292
MNFEYMKNFMDSLTEWIIPGNSVVIYKDGKKVFEYSSGYSDLEKKIKKTGEEQLYIYSCSKVATVTAALQLYEQGKFLLSDPLYEYLPEFKKMYVKDGDRIKAAENPITIRDLFTMTAGLSYATNTPAFEKARKLTDGKMDTRTVIKCLAEEPLLFEPGARWNYSLCHDVLAVLAEVVSGMRFSEYMKKNIFEPLDMNNSYYHAPNDVIVSPQYIYEIQDTKNIVELQQKEHTTGVVKRAYGNELVFGENYDSGGAGIITTVDDYAKFAAALANSGTGLNNNRILSSATVKLMKTNQLNEAQRKTMNWRRLRGYGYGLGVRTLIDKAESGSNSSIGEIGWGGAAGATIIADTEEKVALFYAHHMLNPQEEYYQPRLRNVLYSCL